MQRTTWFARFPLFEGLSVKQIDRLARVCIEKTFAPGAQVVAAGSPSDSMFLILSGELEVQNDGKHLATIKDLETIGEMGVITGMVRSATILATKQSQVLMITREDIAEMVKKDKDFGLILFRNIIRSMSQKIRQTNALLEFSYQV